MGLRETLKKVASTTIKAVGNVSVTVYYHATGAMTYSPALGTQAEAGAVSISATDIAAVASSNSLTSDGTTDFSVQNIPTDTTYIKISGFTDSANNGYTKVSSVASGAIVLTDLTLVDEIKGDTVVIEGFYYKLSVIRYGYTADEIDGETVRLTDEKLLIAANDLAVTPETIDIILIDDIEWNIIRKKTDPVTALWTLQIRRPSG